MTVAEIAEAVVPMTNLGGKTPKQTLYSVLYARTRSRTAWSSRPATAACSSSTRSGARRRRSRDAAVQHRPRSWLTYFSLAMRVEVPANRAFLTRGWHFCGLRTHVLVAAQRRWAPRIVLVARERRRPVTRR
jgi:hypothetical protein